jgi:hypothetical protein
LKPGGLTPVATLVLHWIYGAVLDGLHGAWVRLRAPVECPLRVMERRTRGEHILSASHQ